MRNILLALCAGAAIGKQALDDTSIRVAVREWFHDRAAIVNRRFVQTVCLDDWSSSCYEFTLWDAGKEGLMDGSCSISWGSSRDRALVGNIRGAFGESQSIRFGKGC